MTGLPLPDPAEVHIWMINLAEDPEPGAPPLLDPSERRRAARFRIASARRRFERRRVGLRRVLARYLDCDPAEIAVDRSCARCGHPEHGKPHLPAGSPAFSTAASGDVAVIAVAAWGELGIDIEDPSAIDAAFAQGEPEMLWSEGERRLAGGASLRSIWVRKEALSKALGTGLVADRRELDTSAVPSPWHIYDLPEIAGRRAALAAARTVRSARLLAL